MKGIIALLLIALISCNQKTAVTSISGKELPNIILVMADDLGYGDVACYGNPVVKTPHLDAMARDGIRFNRFYSGAPVCSPTRGSCLTGRHPYRYGIPWAGRDPLPEDEITLAEALKSKGFATGHFGKWHLGGLSRTIIQSEFPDGPSPYSPPGKMDSMNPFPQNPWCQPSIHITMLEAVLGRMITGMFRPYLWIKGREREGRSGASVTGQARDR